MKAFTILVAVFISHVAWSAEDVALTEACKSSLQKSSIFREIHRLEKKREVLASQLTADVQLSYWPDRDDVTVVVHLEDPVDGRSVSYAQKVLKTDARTCKIKLHRRNDSECRYSRPDGGPEALNSIPGLQFVSGRTIRPNSKINALEEAQIRQFLDTDGSDTSLADLIGATDDGELSTGTVQFSNGHQLTYYGAYGGDNPYGIYFVAGAITVAGKNSDGSSCLKSY